MGVDPSIMIRGCRSPPERIRRWIHFLHLRLADPPDDEMIYLEDMASADYLGRPAQMASYLSAFGMLALAVLDPAASFVLIKNAALGE